MADRQKAEARGRRAEWLAALSLMLKGYAILKLRYKTPLGEIDLIARKGRTLVFVEVKARGTVDAAITSVTPKARERISRAAESWQGKYPALADYETRFDVIAVRPWKWPTHFRHAWRGGDW